MRRVRKDGLYPKKLQALEKGLDVPSFPINADWSYVKKK